MADRDRWRDGDRARRGRSGEGRYGAAEAGYYGGGYYGSGQYRGEPGPEGEDRYRRGGFGSGGYGREGRELGGAPDPGGWGGGYGREGYGGRSSDESYAGYEGSFGGYAREAGYGREGGYGPGYGRGGGRGGYGREGYRGRGPGEGRGLWERATDEVASWFGDEEAARRRREVDHRGRGPKGYKRSDERIREDVSDRLADDPYVDASEVEVGVSGGEVTLSGTVDGRAARRRAEDLAEGVSGVAHVQNNLRVRRQDPSGASGYGTTGATGATGGGTTSSDAGPSG
jgi:osmotically-inducible protein OsmY